MTQTDGFIDSATIASILAALALSKGSSEWDRQCLLDGSYLLLFNNIALAPGLGSFRGAAGHLAKVVSTLPFLDPLRFRPRRALASTRAWLTRNPEQLRVAWNRLREDLRYIEWAAVMSRFYWPTHVRMHSSLFSREFIPSIAVVLNCSERELTRLEDAASHEEQVRQWLRTDLASAEAQLAHDAYVVDALIRGRFHEYVAGENRLHMSHHPLREGIARRLRSRVEESIYNTEEFFVKMLVGSALVETTEERRVQRWAANIAKAREAIHVQRLVSLTPMMLQSDAERAAALAVRSCGIEASYSRLSRELDVAIALCVAGLVSLILSPWAEPVGPIATQAYRYYRGTSVGDDVARLTLSTTRRFKRLGRAVPGRIERGLIRSPQEGAGSNPPMQSRRASPAADAPR
jgi:hypothetical protein